MMNAPAAATAKFTASMGRSAGRFQNMEALLGRRRGCWASSVGPVAGRGISTDVTSSAEAMKPAAVPRNNVCELATSSSAAANMGETMASKS